MKRKLLGLLIAVLLLTIVFSGCFENENKKEEKLSIQQLINNAIPGDTIIIPKGVYYENIVINKSINLIGENQNTTIINCSGHGTVINITADYVNVSSFTIQNWGGDAGIEIQSNHTFITDNTINSIIMTGLYLYHSSNNVISGNTIDGNFPGAGIRFKLSCNNTISGNIILNNSWGIQFDSSLNNTISGNIVNNNLYGIVFFSNSSNNVVFYNTVNSNQEGGIFIIDNSSNNTISYNTLIRNYFGGISIGYSNNNTISVNTISNQGDGIDLGYSNNNVILGNTINNNEEGISLFGSNNNTISNNNVSNNTIPGHYGGISISNNGDGVSINDSNNNTIYHNNLMNNTENANDTGNNTWYNTILKEGNYWSDYNGTDTNGDGIGDTPYNISGGNNQDIYPLMFGTSGTVETKKYIKLTSDDNGSNVILNVGDTVNLTLRDYGDGGYVWNIVELDENILNLTMSYNWGASGVPGNLGNFGYDTWIFTAKNIGNTTLELLCYHGWEGAKSAIMNFTAYVEVVPKT